MVNQQGLRVLVVEDQRDVAEMLALSLQMAGHEVEIAANGVSALEVVQEENPDVVFLDIALPGLDGYEVAKGIQAKPARRRPLLVALTGLSDSESRLRSQEAGIDLHLTKPIDPGKLRGLLHRFQTLLEGTEEFESQQVGSKV